MQGPVTQVRNKSLQALGGLISFQFILFLSLLSVLSNNTHALFLLPSEKLQYRLDGSMTIPSSPSSRIRRIPRRVLSYPTFFRLSSSLNDNNDNEELIVPRHVGFICDGNSRWAKKRRLPTSAGHIAGANRFVDLLEYLESDGIQYCTFYGFSTENWNRPAHEIEGIFNLMEQTARKLTHRVLKESSSIEIRLLGDLNDKRIPMSLKNILEELQEATNGRGRENVDSPPPQFTVCLAINYGGRQDILQATQKLAEAVRNNGLSTDEITEETFASYLSTSGIPDPDMIVRTSGESRLSNFLLFQSAYSELYMTPVLWPDFDEETWRTALYWYQQRQRRFGSRHTTERVKEETILTTHNKTLS